MGRVVEKTGKNVNEAIAAALAELNLSIDDVYVDVIDEGKTGLFGLLSGKQAKVRVSELDEDERVPQPGYNSDADNYLTDDSEDDASIDDLVEPADDREDDQEEYQEDEREDELEEDVANGGYAEDADAAADEALIDVNEDDGYEYEVNRAINYLSDIFDGIHVSADISSEPTEEGFQLNIESEDSGILIGHRGETLDSIQYLLNLYMNKGRSAFIRVSVDVENYKMKREAALIRLAGQMAEKVVRLRRNFTLEAMNSYERRIVHSALQNHPKVETYSVGEDPNRKVVVTLKNRGGYSNR